MHHGDAVGHIESFFLIVGDIDKGDAEGFLKIFEFRLHLAAEIEVECAEGFVEQKDARLCTDGTGDGDTLFLTAGEGGGKAAFIAGHTDEAERIGDAADDLGFRYLCFRDTEGVGDIIEDVHMRKERVTLEDGIDLAEVWFGGSNVAAVEDDLPLIGFFESAEDTEECGFSAAGRTEDGEEFAASDLKGEITDHAGFTEGF